MPVESTSITGDERWQAIEIGPHRWRVIEAPPGALPPAGRNPAPTFGLS
jgi:hypothetical protein